MQIGVVAAGLGSALALVAAGGTAQAAAPGAGFVHTATPANVASSLTAIDSPLLNDKPDAVPIVTPNWNPGGIEAGVYNDQEVGVFYEPMSGRWGIYQEDDSAMPIGASFNVFVPAADADAFVHQSDVGNVVMNRTRIDDPASNGNPDAVVFATHRFYDDDVQAGDFYDQTLGVGYDTDVAPFRWGILNQESAVGMGLGLFFDTLVASTDATTQVHVAEAEGVFSSLDLPGANANPDAILIVTQNWSPNEVYNDHVIGVAYDGETTERWAVFNQDLTPIPAGAAFNVMLVPAPEPEALLAPLAALAALARRAPRRG